MICYLYPEPTYLFFSAELPPLFYYSHIPVALATFLIGLYVFWSGRRMLLNGLFFTITTCFSLWIVLNLISWTNIHSDFLLFVWTLFGVFPSIMAVASVYFIYVFLEKKDVSLKLKAVFFALLVPILVLAPTGFNLGGFDITACDAFKFEGNIFKTYYNILGLVAIVWIALLLIRRYRTSVPELKKQVVLMGIGIESLLLLFFAIIFFVSQLTAWGIFPDSRFEMYGLFGMPIFIGFIGYLIVRFKTFNVKLLAAQALVIALWILVPSILFIRRIENVRVVVSITSLLLLALGVYLIRSVLREVQQREQIERLAKEIQRSYELEKKAYELEKKAKEELENLDKTKNQFLLLIQHNLRTPLTSMMGYADLLLNGSFGKINKKTTEVIKKFQGSTGNLIKMVNDFLDVTQFQLGKDILAMKPGIPLEPILTEIVSELQDKADIKGVYLKLEKPERDFSIKADRVKLKAALTNVIDNSIKYTPKGGVTIKVKNHDSIKIIVEDTGIGISPENLKTLFNRIFDRGEAAKKAAATGSGIGLYLASQIIKYHNGKIWAESPGEGKGTTFHIELPLAPETAAYDKSSASQAVEAKPAPEAAVKNIKNI